MVTLISVLSLFSKISVGDGSGAIRVPPEQVVEKGGGSIILSHQLTKVPIFSLACAE